MGRLVLGQLLVEQARSLLPSAPSINRTLAGVLNARAINLARKGSTQEAGATFIHALEIDPDYGDTYANLSRLYLQGGDLDHALEAVDEAIGRDPDRPTHHLLRARVLMQRQDLEAARGAAQTSLALDSRQREGYAMLGEILVRLGEPQ